MFMNCYRWLALALLVIIAGCATHSNHLPLTSFENAGASCYNRATQSHTSVVDAHLHVLPFGGPPVPFKELISYLSRTGVRYATAMGIGQTLPADSTCTYYLDCPGVPATPSLRNDFVNAANLSAHRPANVHLTLSMTFPDLATPGDIMDKIEHLDEEFPGMFGWAGEVNLVKQALFNNGHEPVPKEQIAEWADFMKLLKDRDIPISIHCDLGNNEEPTKYLDLMRAVLDHYPDNEIVWVHMGLSKELTTADPERHIEHMQSFLDRYPNLILDISWRVLWDTYFSKPEIRALYVDLMNRYSERFLPGTDFVAARAKTFEVYAEEIEVTSKINRDLSDEAFRNIALGQNYFRLLGLDHQAPKVCQ